jgi:hypothetical protein
MIIPRNTDWALVTVAVAIAVSTLSAQEAEISTGQLQTSKATLLKASPSVTAPGVGSIDAGKPLRFVQQSPRIPAGKTGADVKAKWYQVVAPKGPLAWVRADAVAPSSVVQPPPPPKVGGIAEAAQKCAANLAACTADGCSQSGTTHAAMNEQKRNFVTGDPTVLTFGDFDTLQSNVESVVELGQEVDDRSVLKNQLNGVGEGSAVRIVAFLAPGTGPHPNTGESVNCNLTGAANNDFHIPVVEEAGQDEFHAIVVEMIPQGHDGGKRNAGWTIAKLQALLTSGSMVRITGQLFYDNAHFPNGDSAHPIGRQPKRFSLWEIHPISTLEVCKHANSCDISSDSDWTPLESSH